MEPWYLAASSSHSTFFTEPVANSCFSIFAGVLSNYVVNLFCKLKIVHSATIVWITCILISSHFLFIYLYLKYCVGERCLYLKFTLREFRNFFPDDHVLTSYCNTHGWNLILTICGGHLGSWNYKWGRSALFRSNGVLLIE